MTIYTWSPVATKPPQGAQVLVREALLTILLWPDVPVRQIIYEDLTIVDRFIVEAALMLAPARTEDIEEITGIPREAVMRIAGQLSGLGLLQGSAGDIYAVKSAAEAALERRAISNYKTKYLTFLYLPHTDELVAFDSAPGSPDPPLLHHAEPVCPVPLDEQISGSKLDEFLRERITKQGVIGLSDDIVDVVNTDKTVPLVGQAYRCRGHAKTTDGLTTLVLKLAGRAGTWRACTIPGATRLVERWSELASRAAGAAEKWRTAGGIVTTVTDTPIDWTFILDARAAELAAQESGVLSRPVRLSIREEESLIDVRVRFQPTDEAARQVFALLSAVCKVTDNKPDNLAATAIRDAAAESRMDFGLADDVMFEELVTERLWQDGHYQHIYAIRAGTDFNYG